MRALFSTGEAADPLAWRDVDLPRIESATDALIRPIAIAACDLDRVIALGRSPFPGAFMLGHEFTGEVVALGDGVSGIAVGDRVLASFQPSCGACQHCHSNHSSVCEAVPSGGMYGIGATGGGWGGALADLIRVPWADFNLAVVPADIDPVAAASASDNLADGLRCVEGPLTRRPGGSVLVGGRGSIALYALVCARRLGASRLTLASSDPFALQVAANLGAECLPVDTWPTRFAHHDITVDCSNDVDGLAAIIKSTAPYGECTSASIHFGPPIPVPMFHMNMKGITFHTGRVNSASHLARVLALLGDGLDPERIEPAYYAMDQAIEGFAAEPFSRKLIFTNTPA